MSDVTNHVGHRRFCKLNIPEDPRIQNGRLSHSKAFRIAKVRVSTGDTCPTFSRNRLIHFVDFLQYKLFYNILYDFLLVLLGRQLSFVVQDLVAPMLSSFSAHPSKRFVTFMCSISSVQFWQEELGYEMKDHI